MKTNLFHIVTILTLCLSVACKSEAQEKVLAEKEGYKLTQKHIDGMLAFAEESESSLSEKEKEAYTQDYISEFLANPKETIKELESYLQNPEPEPEPKLTPDNNNKLAEGHQNVRTILGSDMGQIDFNSKSANNFRSYLANSLLSSESNNYDGVGFKSSEARIQLCENGTFIQALSADVGVDIDGISAYSGNDTDYMPGYWEVASLPNNMLIILFYSTHPSMLEDSPDGLLKFPVAQYTINFVALPNGDGYSRTANQYCN